MIRTTKSKIKKYFEDPKNFEDLRMVAMEYGEDNHYNNFVTFRSLTELYPEEHENIVSEIENISVPFSEKDQYLFRYNNSGKVEKITCADFAEEMLDDFTFDDILEWLEDCRTCCVPPTVSEIASAPNEWLFDNGIYVEEVDFDGDLHCFKVYDLCEKRLVATVYPETVSDMDYGRDRLDEGKDPITDNWDFNDGYDIFDRPDNFLEWFEHFYKEERQTAKISDYIDFKECSEWVNDESLLIKYFPDTADKAPRLGDTQRQSTDASRELNSGRSTPSLAQEK